MAFFRGILHGLGMKEMADRYLETGIDLRRAKSTLVWIQDTLKQSALRNGKHREARLLRLRLAAHRDDSSNVSTIPTIEDFRAENDPDGFYREKELLELYLEAYPQAADPKIRKRQRLIEKQLEALKWIEPLVTTEPVPEDFIAAWFDSPVSDRLILAGIATIGALIEHIRERGYRWWVTVPRLGEKGAARIVAWLHGYEDALGGLPAHATAPLRNTSISVLMSHRNSQTGIVPLESFVVPGDLDGSNGSNRYPGSPRIGASDDYQAIHAWLVTKSGNPNTQRAYRKEAERMLLWAIQERGKALSGLAVEDCAAYRDWLSMLGRTDPENWTFRVPQPEWIGKRNTPRFSPNWRPFEGRLSATSVRQAITIAGSLFEWLVRVQYCAFNPWAAVGKALARSDEVPDVEFSRAFTVGQWQYLMEYLHSLPITPYTQRLRFVMPFAQATGLRLSEMVDATTGRIYTMPLADGMGMRWMLKVYGKGGKWRTVPLPERLVVSLREYLTYRELDSDPMANASDTPLIAGVASNRPVSASALYKTIHSLFADTANALKENGRCLEAKAFDRATVHWLRHTCGSYLAGSGVPVNIIQKLLGHASLATTSIYTNSDEERLWFEIENAGSEMSNAH